MDGTSQPETKETSVSVVVPWAKNPSVRQEFLNEQFLPVYHNPNAGSSAAGMLRWLHEYVADLDGEPEYADMEHFCDQLQRKAQEDEHVEMPAMWYGMVFECARRLIAKAVQKAYANQEKHA